MAQANCPDDTAAYLRSLEYAGFARAVDPRIRTRCLCCPPDAHPGDQWCAWEFTLDDATETP